MAYNNNRNSNRSSRNDDQYENRGRNTRSGNYSDNRSSYNRSSGGRGGRQQQQSDQTYHPLFTIYLGYADRKGKMSFSIKPYEDKEGNPTEITKEQWLAIAADMYDGDFVLRGSLWENEGQYSMANGNLRLTEEELEQYEETKKKTKAPAKGKAPARSSKPKYTEPEIDEEEDEVEYDDESTEEGEDPEDMPY